jgi:Bacterial extracellular solute-binding protein
VAFHSEATAYPPRTAPSTPSPSPPFPDALAHRRHTRRLRRPGRQRAGARVHLLARERSRSAASQAPVGSPSCDGPETNRRSRLISAEPAYLGVVSNGGAFSIHTLASREGAFRNALRYSTEVVIAMMRGLCNGVSFEETMRKLGIAEAMKPKIKPAQGGRGAMALLAKGDIDIGLTFISEIITEPGVEVVGPLPRVISTPTALVGFVSTQAKEPEAAKALLAYLSGPEAAKVYKERGMEPGR